MKRTAIVLIVLSMLASGAWANGAGEAETESYSYTRKVASLEPGSTVWHQQVNDDAVVLFTDEGIDRGYLNVDPKTVPTSVRESIDAVVVAQGADLTDLIYPELKATLVREDVESAYMYLGKYRFEATTRD
ncbi:MAG: hypothetical protein LC667_09845 [Thioalkalivibrio sp.]|nr:hypothetical protein [Thioalkalivibrio sp.]